MESTWNFVWAARNILAGLLIPPSLWIVLGLIFLIALRRHKKIQTTLIGFMFIMIWVTSTTVFSQNLYQHTYRWMKWPKPLDVAHIPAFRNETLHQKNSTQFDSQDSQVKPQAIVILGGGVRNGAIELPQYLYQDVSKETMERLRMGARLAKVTNLPVLVTGGRPNKTSANDRTEGEIMAQVLHDELGVTAKWIEVESNTTQENAHYSTKILKGGNINTIYLVSNDWHLPRAISIYEKEDLKVIPVPTGFNSNKIFTPLDFFPSSRGFDQTRQVLHEVIGCIWYELNY